jgi:hypothetical protein
MSSESPPPFLQPDSPRKKGVPAFPLNARNYSFDDFQLDKVADPIKILFYLSGRLFQAKFRPSAKQGGLTLLYYGHWVPPKTEGGIAFKAL